MTGEMSSQDLKGRLELIESMIAEGRRRTESFGWTFVLWGIAYFVAIAWADWGQRLSIWGTNALAWPVTMFAAALLTMLIGTRLGKGHPGTTIGRAVVSVWWAVGISMILLFPSFGFFGRLDQHVFVALIAGMLGIANGASGFILKWKAQIACAVVWWLTSVAAFFGSDAQVAAVFLGAVFICQIVFGVYAMVLESRRQRDNGVAHA